MPHRPCAAASAPSGARRGCTPVALRGGRPCAHTPSAPVPILSPAASLRYPVWRSSWTHQLLVLRRWPHGHLLKEQNRRKGRLIFPKALFPARPHPESKRWSQQSGHQAASADPQLRMVFQFTASMRKVMSPNVSLQENEGREVPAAKEQAPTCPPVPQEQSCYPHRLAVAVTAR